MDWHVFLKGAQIQLAIIRQEIDMMLQIQAIIFILQKGSLVSICTHIYILEGGEREKEKTHFIVWKSVF
jgi:hypothetical protein